MDKPEITLEAEWGTVKMSDGPLGLMAHLCQQLEYFLKAGVSPNPEFTKAELAGYRLVLETGSETVANAFLDLRNVRHWLPDIVNNFDPAGRLPTLECVRILREKGIMK